MSAAEFTPGPIRTIRAGQQPPNLGRFRKLTTIALEWVAEPFTVTTMEGTTYLIGETNEHWDGGYWVAWPDDGTDPYPIAPSFVRDNYVPAAGPAPLPGGIHPCPTCDRVGCERCAATGRGAYARVYADNDGHGRATFELWFGAAATMERVATSDHSLAHDRVDSILATLGEAPGVVIRDRRGR